MIIIILWNWVRKCCILNVVFSFVFTISCFKHFECNKQWLNTVLSSSLLIFFVWVLNYKCQTNYLGLYLWNLPKFLQHIVSWGIWILKTKSKVCKGSFFNFYKFISFTTTKKLDIWIFRKTSMLMSSNIEKHWHFPLSVWRLLELLSSVCM